MADDYSKKFEEELEGFRKEVHSAIQFFYAYMAINEIIVADKEALKAVNETPLFWKTIGGALQVAFFITLARVFDIDKGTKHNLKSLMLLTEQYKGIFSKSALATRKKAPNSSLTDTQIKDYVDKAYEPTDKDFQALVEQTKLHEKIYQGNYDAIRDKIYAHKELSDAGDIENLFAKTNVNELEKLLTFLAQLYDALWELFNNGRKPELRPMEHSAKTIFANRPPPGNVRTVQQSIIGEAQDFFNLLLSAFRKSSS